MGTIINSIAVFIGSIIGLILKERFSESMRKLLMDALGLVCIPLGLQMTLKGEKFLHLVFSLVLGGILGELIRLDDIFKKISNKVEEKFSREKGNFAKGFLTASLLYCIGPMTIMGSIQDGLGQTPTILLTKSLLDGTASIALASALGIGVAFSSLSVLFVQGFITLLAHYISPILTNLVVQEMSAVGGILVLGIALNLLEIKNIKVANLLPSLIFIILLLKIFP
ncbi:MAG: DUF554 domain-containing protein [Dictyoglomaceae bacterium]|nr:DUF554 domain-containing protein [Dictyoglomaceae bacterium]